MNKLIEVSCQKNCGNRVLISEGKSYYGIICDKCRKRNKSYIQIKNE